MKKLLLYILLLLVPGVVGSGCFGGGGSSVEADPAPVSQGPTATTLSASTSALVLSVNDTALSASLTGYPRTFTLTNTGSETARAVAYAVSPPLPSGTTIAPANCGNIAPAASCVLTITPGAIPSAAAGDINPTAIMLAVAGTNTNTLSLPIDVLTYGSVHQSGYVFAVDDTTSTTGSIGGKVAALSDQAAPYPAGVMWSSDGNGGTVYDAIAGIYETSTDPPDACNGRVDGACNSRAIIAFYSPPQTTPAIDPSSYAAGRCSGTIGNRSDWYLPAICEMGYDSPGFGTGCGTRAAPTAQNMHYSLAENGNIGNFSVYYWSSTGYSALPDQYAHYQVFDAVGGIYQGAGTKFYSLGVRCARAMTN